MARVTAITAASISLMAAHGELTGQGLLPPERLVTGPPLQRLQADLEAEDIRFCLTWQQSGALVADDSGLQPRMQPCRPRRQKQRRAEKIV